MINQDFKISAKFKSVSLALLAIGIVSLLGGIFFYVLKGDTLQQTRFWATLLQNSIFFLLICLASVFILAATSLAQGAWIISLRRIPEAIGSIVWVLATIVAIVLAIIIGSKNHHIYHWLQKGYIPDNSLNSLKNFFLSGPFFLIWSGVVLTLWSFFGIKFRQLSLQQDAAKKGDTKIFWLNFKWSAGFLLLFALSLMSTIPWLWLMSLDSHWFSTMYSWYTFASSFVSGMSMIMLFVLYTKRQGYLELVNTEHIHDLGKFMFAFSIFWTYLWFSQFMLIWYANIPEETVYFQPRFHGPYKFFFWANLIINFLSPVLILMPAPNKRNYFVVSLVAILILLGHWIDFYQMVMPATVAEHWNIGLFEIGIVCGFIGLIMYLVGNKLTQSPMLPKNHPFLKETVIHIS